MSDHPEDAPPPKPENAPRVETGRRFVTRLRNFLMDPRVYLPAIGVVAIWLATVIYGYYKPNIAHHIAEMVTQYDEFPGENGKPNVKNPLLEKIETVFANHMNGAETSQLIDRRIDTRLGSPEAQKALMDALIATLAEEGAASDLKHEIGEMVVTALLEFDGNLEKNPELDEMLRNTIGELISQHVERIGFMESEYGRVDSVFTKTVELAYDPDSPQLSAEIRFFAEEHQVIQLHVDNTLIIPQPGQNPQEVTFTGNFIRSEGGGFKEIKEKGFHNITSLLKFEEGGGVHLQTIIIGLIDALFEGQVAVLEVTLIVRNSRPVGVPLARSGAGGTGGLGNE